MCVHVNVYVCMRVVVVVVVVVVVFGGDEDGGCASVRGSVHTAIHKKFTSDRAGPSLP